MRSPTPRSSTPTLSSRRRTSWPAEDAARASTTGRGYAFTGSLFCGVCERRMQAHWINAAPYYRCRFAAEYALANKVSHPCNVYLREDAFDAQVNDWLATVFAPASLTGTIDQIMAGQQAHTDHVATEAATARIEDATSKMARYRAAPGATPRRSASGSPRPRRSALPPKPSYARQPPARRLCTRRLAPDPRI